MFTTINIDNFPEDYIRVNLYFNNKGVFLKNKNGKILDLNILDIKLDLIMISIIYQSQKLSWT